MIFRQTATVPTPDGFLWIAAHRQLGVEFKYPTSGPVDPMADSRALREKLLALRTDASSHLEYPEEIKGHTEPIDREAYERLRDALCRHKPKNRQGHEDAETLMLACDFVIEFLDRGIADSLEGTTAPSLAEWPFVIEQAVLAGRMHERLRATGDLAVHERNKRAAQLVGRPKGRLAMEIEKACEAVWLGKSRRPWPSEVLSELKAEHVLYKGKRKPNSHIKCMNGVCTRRAFEKAIQAWCSRYLSAKEPRRGRPTKQMGIPEPSRVPFTVEEDGAK